MMGYRYGLTRKFVAVNSSVFFTMFLRGRYQCCSRQSYFLQVNLMNCWHLIHFSVVRKPRKTYSILQNSGAQRLDQRNRNSGREFVYQRYTTNIRFRESEDSCKGMTECPHLNMP